METIPVWLVYVVVMLPTLGELVTSIGLMILVSMVIWGFLVSSIKNGDKIFVPSNPKRTRNIGIWLVVGLLGLGTAIPTTPQMAAIVAGHWAVNNEQVRELPDQVGLILDSFISDMQGEGE